MRRRYLPAAFFDRGVYMADITIDHLQIEIEAEAKKGADGLDKFIASIEKLKGLTSGSVAGLSNLGKKFKTLNSYISELNGLKGKSSVFNNLSKSLERLGQVNLAGVSAQIAGFRKALNSLNSIPADVQAIVNAMGSLSSKSLNMGDAELYSVKRQAQIAKAQADIEAATARMARSKASMEKLTAATNKAAQAADFAANKYKYIDEAVTRFMNTRNAALDGEFLPGGKGLGFTKSAMASSLEPLRNYLNDVIDLDTLKQQVGYVSDEMKELGNSSKQAMNQTTSHISFAEKMSQKFGIELERLKALFKELGFGGKSGMDTIAQSTQKAVSDANRAAKAYENLSVKTKVKSGSGGLGSLMKLGKITTVLYAINRVTSGIGSFVTQINEYIENINLFTVSMGDLADEAEGFAMRLQTDLGFDSGEAMRYLGVFQQLSTSFGLAGDRAYILSKNLTQLGYDISSFYNLSAAESFQKLQAAVSGEIEPIRRLGIDISAARLQQELYALGIDATVDSLTQADKETLRYIAIMKQVGNVQGDAARTIQGPANSLRVFSAQLQIAARNIGSIFIPALTAILPYAIAVVRVIGEAAAALASFLGFEMPEFDYSGLNNGLGEVSSGIDSVGDSAQSASKKMNRLISGFDELNILSKEQAGAGSGIGAGGILGDVELPQYDMFAGLVENQLDEITEKIRGLMEDIVPESVKQDFEWIVSKLQEIFDFTSESKGRIAQYLSDGLSVIPVYLANIGIAITGVIEIAEGLYTIFDSLVNGDWAGALLGALDVVNGLKDTLVGLVSLPLEPIYNGLQKIAGYLGIDWFKPHDWFVALKQALLDFDLGKWWVENIAPWFTQEKWEELLGNVKSAFSQGFENIKGAASKAWGKVVAFFDETIPTFWEEHVTPWFTLEKWADLFFNIGAAMGSAVTDFVNQWVKPVTDWWNNDVTPWFTKARWQELGSVIGRSVREAVDSFVEYWTITVPNWWDEHVAPFFTLERWQALVSSIWQAISSAVTKFVTDWGTRIGAWWNSVKKVFLPSTWLNIAQQAVQGLLNGFRGLFSDAGSLARNFVEGFKSALGIHSPSTVFENIGINIMQGLWNGLKSLWYEILDWWERVVRFPAITVPSTSVGKKSTSRYSYDTSSYSASPVNWYAKGGAFYDEAIIGVGDNPNASNDPEVVAPTSLIEQAVINANGELVNAMYQMAAMIVQAIESNQVQISADSRGIFKMVQKEAAGQYSRTGKPAF